MSNIASAADGVIERAFDLPFGYCATFIWRGSDEPIEVHWLPDLPHIRKPRLQRKMSGGLRDRKARLLRRCGCGRRR